MCFTIIKELKILGLKILAQTHCKVRFVWRG